MKDCGFECCCLIAATSAACATRQRQRGGEMSPSCQWVLSELADSAHLRSVRAVRTSPKTTTPTGQLPPVLLQAAPVLECHRSQFAACRETSH